MLATPPPNLATAIVATEPDNVAGIPRRKNTAETQELHQGAIGDSNAARDEKVRCE